MQEKICLIIPCYNEAKRLDFKRIDAYPNVTLIFVNDHSVDDTLELLKNRKRNHDFLIDLPENAGKAEAVRQGMLFARGLPFFDRLDWIGYWDADFAAPLSELPGFVGYSRLFSNVDSVWGSRIYKYGADIRRSFKRHVFGRFFATVASYLLDLPSYDTQCGAKLFRPALVTTAFGEPFTSRWIFDVELCFRLKNHSIIEYPLSRWVDMTGGSVQVPKLMLRTLVDLLKIRKRYGSLSPALE